jgi:hypothetical protein
MKIKTILLGMLLAFSYIGMAYSEPKVGETTLVDHACTLDAGMKVFKAATEGGDPVREWAVQLAAGTCGVGMAVPVEVKSVLAKAVDKDGDLMYVIDIGDGWVTFVWEEFRGV